MNHTSKKEKALSFLAVFAAVFLLYGQTLGFDFVWDDYIEVLGNTAFHQASNFWKFFTTPYWTLMTGGFAPYHRPMIPLMILTVSTFFGKNPFGYHLLNLILYTLTCWVFFLYIRRLTLNRWIAGVAAALFLSHPAHAEVVSWGSARPVLLSGLCFVTCLLFSYHTAAAQNIRERFLFFTGLILTFSVGLLSYHSILTLAPLIFLSDFFNPTNQKKPVRLRIAEYASYALLGGGFIFYCLFLFHRMGETDLRPLYNVSTANLIYTHAPLEWLLTPLNTLTRYSEILLFPTNLVPDTAFQASHLSISALGTFISMIILTFVLAKLKTNRKILFFSILWMFCGILTVANLVPQGGLFADRYVFISSMGFSLWLTLGLHTLKESHPQGSLWVKILLLLILGGYGFKTLSYSQVWRNDLTYWLEASILAPHKARTHNKLGIALESMGHSQEAAEEYQSVLNLDPENFLMTYLRLAEMLKKLGRTEKAAEYEKIFQMKSQEISKRAAEAGKEKDPLFVLNN